MIYPLSSTTPQHLVNAIVIQFVSGISYGCISISIHSSKLWACCYGKQPLFLHSFVHNGSAVKTTFQILPKTNVIGVYLLVFNTLHSSTPVTIYTLHSLPPQPHQEIIRDWRVLLPAPPPLSACHPLPQWLTQEVYSAVLQNYFPSSVMPLIAILILLFSSLCN